MKMGFKKTTLKHGLKIKENVEIRTLQVKGIILSFIQSFLIRLVHNMKKAVKILKKCKVINKVKYFIK